jgi:hypothetical protein
MDIGDSGRASIFVAARTLAQSAIESIDVGGTDLHLVHGSARVGDVLHQRLHGRAGCPAFFLDLFGGVIDGAIDYCRPLFIIGCASGLAPSSLIQLQKEIRMLIRLFAFVFYVACWAQPLYAAPAKEDALQFDIPIVRGAEKYLDLLEYPAYLVVALENNGISTSNMGRPTLIDERTIQLKNATLRYTGKKGAVYAYTSSLDWDFAFRHLKFEVPVELDTSSLSKGNIRVRVFLPLANLFPEALVKRIRMKIQILSGPEVQKRMLGYFDDLSKNTGPASGLQGLFTKIMLQSYSTPADVGGAYAREPGDAEPLSDQAYLLATLAIWLIIGPVSITAFFFWRSRKNRDRKS